VVGAILLQEGEAAAEHAAAAPNWFVEHAWIIVLLPMVSAALTLLIGKRTPGKGTVYGIGAVGAGLVLSLGVLWQFVQHGGATYESNVEWFQIGELHVGAGQLVDGLTAVMLIVVTAISLAVHVYSLGYMHGDQRYTWFYVVLSLFTAAMLNVVIASDLFQLLVGWEIMGVCSYLLIGHWWEEHVNSSSAIKAFITTRIGDVPFMFGIFTLVFVTGFESSNIVEVGEALGAPGVSKGLAAAAALLLFGGTIGKSAQFPLHVWLPDAMAGPTPVSALIHAATMVAAGVYLVGRMFEVFVTADPVVLTIVSVVAGITAFGAATMAFVQDDIKRVLAYSTVSQLAYMVAGLSMGPAGVTAGYFHLFTHAFFKALLFLGSGSVIHAVHSNNMSEMGGLRRPMPVTFWTFLIGSLALAGIPPLAGFWSKDELLVVANAEGHDLLFAVLLITAGMTAFYMARAVMLTFFGEYRGHGHPHESPGTITGPLVALAAATVLVGFLGAPQLGAPFGQWVFFEEPHEAEFVLWVALASTTLAVLAIAVGVRVYRREDAVERDPMLRMGMATRLLVNKYYLDDIYWKGIIRPIRDPIAAAVYWSNQNIIDGVVNGAAGLTRALASVVHGFDRRVIDGVVNGIGNLAGFTGGLLRYVQSGNVQRYAAFLFTGVVVLAIIFTRI
jgi:NADH-quinone oxidoreductase subunit L